MQFKFFNFISLSLICVTVAHFYIFSFLMQQMISETKPKRIMIMMHMMSYYSREVVPRDFRRLSCAALLQGLVVGEGV